MQEDSNSMKNCLHLYEYVMVSFQTMQIFWNTKLLRDLFLSVFIYWMPFVVFMLFSFLLIVISQQIETYPSNLEFMNAYENLLSIWRIILKVILSRIHRTFQ